MRGRFFPEVRKSLTPKSVARKAFLWCSSHHFAFYVFVLKPVFLVLAVDFMSFVSDLRVDVTRNRAR